MEMTEVCAIQNYNGKFDGRNLFTWGQITIPKCKEEYIEKMNEKIQEIFELTQIERTKVIDALVMMEHNNGINQYFSFLREYASKEVSEFICAASSTDTLNLGQGQKVK